MPRVGGPTLTWQYPGRQVLALAALSAALLALPACKKKPPEMVFGQTVRGKVTFKGEPVRYGFVLLFNPERSFDAKTGAAVPAAAAMIRKDGTYETNTAPTGLVFVCVATDPDLQPMELMQ